MESKAHSIAVLILGWPPRAWQPVHQPPCLRQRDRQRVGFSIEFRIASAEDRLSHAYREEVSADSLA